MLYEVITFNGFIVLIKGLIAVRQAEKGVIVAGVRGEAFGIVVNGIAEFIPLSGGVAQTDERVVIFNL